MANEQNLIPFTERTKSEHRALAIAGGKASGASRRRRKTLKEELLLMLSDTDVQNSVTAALIERAADGDVRAFEVLRDTIGEKPVDKVVLAEVDQSVIDEVEKAVLNEPRTGD